MTEVLLILSFTVRLWFHEDNCYQNLGPQTFPLLFFVIMLLCLFYSEFCGILLLYRRTQWGVNCWKKVMEMSNMILLMQKCRTLFDPRTYFTIVKQKSFFFLRASWLMIHGSRKCGWWNGEIIKFHTLSSSLA